MAGHSDIISLYKTRLRQRILRNPYGVHNDPIPGRSPIIDSVLSQDKDILITDIPALTKPADLTAHSEVSSHFRHGPS